jgi:hypothetical protein
VTPPVRSIWSIVMREGLVDELLERRAVDER